MTGESMSETEGERAASQACRGAQLARRSRLLGPLEPPALGRVELGPVVELGPAAGSPAPLGTLACRVLVTSRTARPSWGRRGGLGAAGGLTHLCSYRDEMDQECYNDHHPPPATLQAMCMSSHYTPQSFDDG